MTHLYFSQYLNILVFFSKTNETIGTMMAATDGIQVLYIYVYAIMS